MLQYSERKKKKLSLWKDSEQKAGFEKLNRKHQKDIKMEKMTK